jgi:tRNA(Arg) A34 adenosine deaminase TadA
MKSEFMKLSIEEAKKSSEKIRCGAVVVKDGKIIAKSHNSQRSMNDASAHAEINAIRDAGRKLGDKNLEGCEIYCTCEPCVMCLSAITFAKIRKITYGLSLKDAFPKNRIIDIDIDMFLKKVPYEIEVSKNFMKDECSRLLSKNL